MASWNTVFVHNMLMIKQKHIKILRISCHDIIIYGHLIFTFSINLVNAVCKSIFKCFTPSSTTKHLNKDKLCLLILPSQFKYAHACLFCLHFLCLVLVYTITFQVIMPATMLEKKVFVKCFYCFVDQSFIHVYRHWWN